MTVPVSELQSIAPSAIIELFELQLNTAIQGSNTIYRFHAGTNATGTNDDVVWAGNTYQAFPIEAEGFEYSGNGQLPRPKIRVSNILGTITAIILATPLEGAKVTRIRTMARYLDAVNFEGGTNPYGTPDSTAEFPREVYYIDRKSAETRDVVEFELAAAVDLVGVRAPKRQCISNICQWVYRSAECSYTGPPVANENDQLLTGLRSSSQAIAYENAKIAFEAVVTPYNNAQNALNVATNTMNSAQGQWVLAEERIDEDNYVIANASISHWSGSVVSIGSEYRIGSYQYSSYWGDDYVDYYSIQRWYLDSSPVTAAQAAYGTALTNYNTALANYNTALAARNAAFAAWQASPSFQSEINASGDVCGKRLSSCKLRFGSTSVLNFGSFPGVGTYFT